MSQTQLIVAFLGVLLVIVATAENWTPEVHALVSRP